MSRFQAELRKHVSFNEKKRNVLWFLFCFLISRGIPVILEGGTPRMIEKVCRKDQRDGRARRKL